MPLAGITNERDSKGWSPSHLSIASVAGLSDVNDIPAPGLSGAGVYRKLVDDALWSRKEALVYMPSTGATGTGSGLLGAPWTPLGTVSHPTPTAGMTNQHKRTQFVDVITTTNQELGIRMAAASEAQFWRGNAAGQGGFLFVADFQFAGSALAATTRLFVGLASGVTGLAVSDTPSGDFIGLWHDTTDAAAVLSIITMNNTTRTKTPIAQFATLGQSLTGLVAGQGYRFYMVAIPNDTSVYWRLDDTLTNLVVAQGVMVDTAVAVAPVLGNASNAVQVALPRSTVFLAPQCESSNGTANIVAGDTGIAISLVYAATN